MSRYYLKVSIYCHNSPSISQKSDFPETSHELQVFLGKCIQCILPGMLHLSGCNVIPGKINETRSTIFWAQNNGDTVEQSQPETPAIPFLLASDVI